jgi:hypothetical protein
MIETKEGRVQVQQGTLASLEKSVGCVANYRMAKFRFNPKALFTGVSGQ